MEATQAASTTQEKLDDPSSTQDEQNKQQGAATSQSLQPKILTPRQQARRTKLLSSIETSKSNISTTEFQLASKIQEVTQLESFKQQTTLNYDQDKAALAHAQVVANKHISSLKRYNEIKDIALGMLGLIAEKEGKRLAEVMEERGVSEKSE